MNDGNRLLTDAEAADFLQVPTHRIVRMAKAKMIPHVRLPNGEMRFVDADLWTWIEEHKQAEAQQPARPAEVSSCK